MNHSAQASHPTPSSAYIGRFAPSPTGELHHGSLLTAVASYVDAHHQGGQWLVRMEDLDPPREQQGAADAILRALEAHGLLWHASVIYQSQRHEAYTETLHRLEQQHLVYPCTCNRQRLTSLPAYDGYCLKHPLPASTLAHTPHALRITVNEGRSTAFKDLFQGEQPQNLHRDVGDFVIKRKDGLFAYQLAVTVDDREQGITHVIRGSDLLDSTARQIYLFQCFNSTPPVYGHLPVIVNKDGQKLSKQTFAEPIQDARANHNLHLALQRLGQQPPPELKQASCQEILEWAINHWQRAKIPAAMSIKEGYELG